MPLNPSVLRTGAWYIALLLCACTARDRGAELAAPSAGPSALPSQLSAAFESPSTLLTKLQRSVSTIDEPLFKSGNANSLGLPANAVDPWGNRMNFHPAWTAGDALSHAAYCGYLFDLTGYAEPLEISCAFASAPDNSGQVYLGVANFAKNAWDWFALPLCGTVNPTPTWQYSSDSSKLMLVMLVSIGEQQLQLANIRIGNSGPTAAFTMTTGLGLPGEVVDFDASASNDPDGCIYRYQWDPEGDGTYLPLFLNPHGSATKSVTYSQPGTYHPTLKVTDDSGATATVSDDVLITLGNYYSGTLDPTENAGQACNAALVNGSPAVAYMAGDELRYIYALSPEALNWSDIKVIDPISGGWPDLAVIAGRPAIAFQSGGNDLGYVRANNASGSSWPVPAIAAYKTGSEYSGFTPSLADVCGMPDIAYGDHEVMDFAGNIWLVRADDLGGASWQAPVQVNTPGTLGLCPSLAYIYGVPVVGFAKVAVYPQRELRCSRALDPFGNHWNTPILAAGGGTAYSNSSSLMELAGKPVLGYWDDADGTLKVVRGAQVEGLTWGTSFPITASTDTYDTFSFCVIHGLPCCAYNNDGSGLYYVIAKNSLGSEWNTPLCFDAAADPHYISLTAVYDLPAIAYCDVDSGTLKGALKFAIYE